MKKIFLSAAIIAATFFANAQNTLVLKSGEKMNGTLQEVKDGNVKFMFKGNVMNFKQNEVSAILLDSKAEDQKSSTTVMDAGTRGVSFVMAGRTLVKQPKVDNLFLDCGARNKKQVEDVGIHVGNAVTYADGFDEVSYGNFIARAFDNRIGGFMIAEVARLLKENKKTLPFALYIVNAVQEEIGLRGAEMIARRIKPDIAIITDVTHDSTTPMINKLIEGDCACGKGPALVYGPAVHNKLLGVIEKVAEKNKIPLQLRAVSRSTGTDTDSFAYANDGCPSALISIPLRYMHTTVEMLHRDDVNNTIKLIYESVLALTPKTNLSYF